MTLTSLIVGTFVQCSADKGKVFFLSLTLRPMSVGTQLLPLSYVVPHSPARTIARGYRNWNSDMSIRGSWRLHFMSCVVYLFL